MNKRAFGLSLIVLSALFAFSNLKITGGVIGISPQYFNLISIILFISGVALVFMAKSPALISLADSGIGITYSDKFKRAARRHNVGRVNQALAKIGTGLGKPHTISTKEKSIDGVENGARMIFDQTDSNNVHVKAYLSSHEYDAYLRNTR
jgi:hypothetical protein